MNNFTKQDLKPNMILELKEFNGINRTICYYVGTSILPLNYGSFLNLSDFSEDLIYTRPNDCSYILSAVYEPNPHSPFNEDDWEKLWERQDDTNILEMKFDKDLYSVWFAPNGEAYTDEDKSRLMYVEISTKTEGFGTSLSLDNMKEIRDNFTKIIEYVENNS